MKKDNLHKNNGGFKVPDNYFERLENKLSEKILSENNSDDVLKSRINSGLKVPEKYFDSIEDRVLQHIEPQKTNRKVISLFTRRNLVYVSGIAAMIAIIFSISINKEKSLNFNDIDIADIHAYFDEEGIDLTATEIASLFDENTTYEETFEEEFINDDDLLEYLSNENIEDDIIFLE
ncbi:hypothetical protein [Aquimarina mytili]|uniref:Uncharacterized protein n=1 Tax=Aquimarina mytili TaxID=874423 RepID=A0A936ZYU8_9FLAO|nr:hypothetical protein [Aquimarina mytili]MBL0684473.1 hypothetical protein [Aquimarina mytili]